MQNFLFALSAHERTWTLQLQLQLLLANSNRKSRTRTSLDAWPFLFYSALDGSRRTPRSNFSAANSIIKWHNAQNTLKCARGKGFLLHFHLSFCATCCKIYLVFPQRSAISCAFWLSSIVPLWQLGQQRRTKENTINNGKLLCACQQNKKCTEKMSS